MKSKSLIIIILFMIIFIISCTAKQEINLIQSEEIRLWTFNNCKNLLNKNVDFKGTVLYEECGKNCLGGCPNSGPNYCYYGIQDNNGCLAFLKSRITEFPLAKQPEQIFNKFNIGQYVNINREVSLYYSHYCGKYGNNEPECSYFILDKV